MTNIKERRKEIDKGNNILLASLSERITKIFCNRLKYCFFFLLTSKKCIFYFAFYTKRVV